MRLRDDDEADRTQSIELFSKFCRDGNRRMENELPVVESDHCHANGDLNQPSLPTELVLGAPEIPVVSN